MGLDRYKVDVPEGVSGIWRVERFDVGEHDLGRLSFAMDGRPIPPGTYTRLMRGGHLVMSDTPAEVCDHYEAIRRATGRVLVHGLGIGMVLKAVLEKPDVTHVDVVEKSPDVIALVAPHYADPRVNVIEGDALTYKFPKGMKWDIAWHDIWDDMCEDDLPEMARLKRRYGRRVKWQGCWGQEHILYRRNRRYY